MSTEKNGIVYIVGAGPGDKKLITVKGMACLQKADVVIYDLLLNDSLLDYCPEHTLKIKAPDPRIRATRQDELNQLLLQHAKAGKVVVRLKGGDPFIFGRGGEEATVLVQGGIPFEIVPGVTAGIAASAYAGIPVTHRDFASSVAFVTGHSAAMHADSNINWSQLATAVDTLIVYMGVAHLSEIVNRLISNGRDKHTPVSLVRVGTTPQQTVVQGTLENIAEKVEAVQMNSPAIIIVGHVNNLREHLRWFDTKPLFGKRILITRARAQASEFAERLEENGAEVIQFPTIEIHPIKLRDEQIPTPDKYNWVIFTSVNAVEIYYSLLNSIGLDTRAFLTCQVCAVGPKTIAALNGIGIKPDFVPTHSSGNVIARELQNVQDKNILLPRAKIATADLPQRLRERGAHVHDVAIYDTLKVESECGDVILKDLLEGKIDIVTFTSSSTVRNFLEMFPEQNPKELLSKVHVAVIGPTTEATARKHGVKVNIISKDATIESLTQAVLSALTPRID
ncbi:uroporphyrinogen-III C-methyltransferase [Candidatus Poribacteria bacterium]|nr:uroporphyrinogen-III C-methyltransferase [Candidatus Poribacteria bacterium]MYB64179.1 uroporphyrinogen-III C-methyltransferase [Candidatus Poribacteria bacterium]MYF57242.1 uroporphyrinogen-III C-methyltransferase [Candidatus Poribacteria bacterium]